MSKGSGLALAGPPGGRYGDAGGRNEFVQLVVPSSKGMGRYDDANSLG